MAKTDPLDSFLDEPQNKKCVTCRAAKRDPKLKAALDKYEERRRDGTTQVGIQRFFNFLQESGTWNPGGSWHKLNNHFRDCCGLISLTRG